MIDQVLSGCPPALEPLYRTPQPNAAVSLWRGPLELSGLPLPIGGQGELALHWLPRPEVRFTIKEPAPNSLYAVPAMGKRAELALTDKPARVSCIVTEVGEDVSGVTSDRVQIGASTGLKCLYFHLANLPQVIGGRIYRQESRSSVAGRIALEAGGWLLALDPVPGIAELVKAVGAAGGYGITHVGKLERAAGDEFSVAEADQILQVLKSAMSFARGFWTPPSLCVGFDPAGNRVHEEWTCSITTAWRNVGSWFSAQTRQMLPTFFLAFKKRCDNQLWRDTLDRAIWWYISANLQGGGIEGAIVLTQVALELLSWVIYVEDGHIVSRQGFDDLSAADKLRLLLSWMRVPLEVPTKLAALAAFSKRSIPYATYKFTEVRNALVHPKNRDVLDNAEEVLFDAWRLGLWYLELATLRASGYVGPYVNRIRVAKVVEDVPWK